MKLILNEIQFNLIKEEITAGSTIVYHRTTKYAWESIVKTGFNFGNGDFYGYGVYTTYELESQLDERMRKLYGEVIIECQVSTIKDFLILDEDIRKKIYGYNISIEKHIRNVIGSKANKLLKDYDFVRIINNNYLTSETLKELVNSYKSFIRMFKGVIYTGGLDGRCLLSYDPSLVEPRRVSFDDGKTWKNVTNLLIYNRKKSASDLDGHTAHIINKIKMDGISSIGYLSREDLISIKKYDINLYKNYFKTKYYNDTLSEDEVMFFIKDFPNTFTLLLKNRIENDLYCELTNIEIEFAINRKETFNLILKWFFKDSYGFGGYIEIIDKYAQKQLLKFIEENLADSNVFFDKKTEQYILKNKDKFKSNLLSNYFNNEIDYDDENEY